LRDKESGGGPSPPDPMTKRWWEDGPKGARSIKGWIASTEGKSTPLLQAIIGEIERLELLLIETAEQSPEVLSDKLRLLERRLRRLEGKGPQLPGGEPPAQIVPLHLMIGKHISDALNLCGGDVEMAAEALEIGQATIYRKMKKYGMDVKSIRRAARKEAGERSDESGPAPGEVQVPGDHGSGVPELDS